jgi:hypothetical protein
MGGRVVFNIQIYGRNLEESIDAEKVPLFSGEADFLGLKSLLFGQKS